MVQNPGTQRSSFCYGPQHQAQKGAKPTHAEKPIAATPRKALALVQGNLMESQAYIHKLAKSKCTGERFPLTSALAETPHISSEIQDQTTDPTHYAKMLWKSVPLKSVKSQQAAS